MRWKDRLTKKELKHLKENKVNTLAKLKVVYDHHMDQREKGSYGCWNNFTVYPHEIIEVYD